MSLGVKCPFWRQSQLTLGGQSKSESTFAALNVCILMTFDACLPSISTWPIWFPVRPSVGSHVGQCIRDLERPALLIRTLRAAAKSTSLRTLAVVMK